METNPRSILTMHENRLKKTTNVRRDRFGAASVPLFLGVNHLDPLAKWIDRHKGSKCSFLNR